ncbi:MAG: sigma-54-dependent Fis family transcriptional regulator [Nitrospirae bacterium]|nr:sigma-54-dependent Fis family transcriptional regulator [Nitrospirota bacterium]
MIKDLFDIKEYYVLIKECLPKGMKFHDRDTTKSMIRNKLEVAIKEKYNDIVVRDKLWAIVKKDIDDPEMEEIIATGICRDILGENNEPDIKFSSAEKIRQIVDALKTTFWKDVKTGEAFNENFEYFIDKNELRELLSDGIDNLKEDLMCSNDSLYIKNTIEKFRRGDYDIEVAVSYLNEAIRLGDTDAVVVFRNLFYKDFEDNAEYFSIADYMMYFEGVDDLTEIDIETSDNPRLLFTYLQERRTYLNKIYFMAKSDLPVLIIGETGTGKEQMASVIHKISGRSAKIFIKINCASFAVESIENELFGHAEDALSDSVNKKKGYCKLADGGTLFLDEIDCLAPFAQVKLLRMILNGEYNEIGASRPTKINIRIIAACRSQELACNKILPELLNGMGYPGYVRMPALKDLMNLLPEGIIGKSKRTATTRLKIKGNISIDPEVTEIIQKHTYPGNFRELDNILTAALLASRAEGRNKILAKDIESIIKGKVKTQCTPEEPVEEVKLKDIIEYAEDKRKKIIKNKLLQLKREGREYKQVLIDEGLPQRNYEEFMQKLRSVFSPKIYEKG